MAVITGDGWQSEIMKLLGIETNTDKVVAGYAQDGKKYLRFALSPKSELSRVTFEVKDYRSYKHFAEAMSNFDHRTRFLERPVHLPALTFESARSVCLEHTLDDL